MNDSKLKKTTRNIFFGFALRILQLILPFIARTAIIKVLGMEYVGLNSLFTSILQVLNIAELGVGFTLVYSMYKPICENDTPKICALMNLYRRYYNIIGLVILILGIAISPFLPYLISGDVPADLNLYILYFLNLASTVFSYWLFAYRNCLFAAHQRNDIISKITFVINIITYSIQIILLFLFKNYYLYVVVIVVMQIASNMVVAFMSLKYYPNYKPAGFLEKQEQKQINRSVKDIFYGQIGFVVTNSVDAVVISAFLGLIPLALYQNYYFILSALISFFTVFFQSMRAGIGTNLITKNKNENYKDYKFVTFVVIGALSFCTPCLISLYQPFMKLWVGNDNMLDNYCVLLFGAFLVTYELCLAIGSYKDSSGIWHADRFRPLVTAITNLTLNIILVNIIGIYGILISTIVAYVLVNIPWLIVRVFKDIFEKNKMRNYILFLGKGLFTIVLSCTASFTICSLIQINNVFLELGLKLLIVSAMSVVIFIAFYFKTEQFKKSVGIIKSKLFKNNKTV